ncbi:YdcH family protein [Colwelliaceae bacterium 6471]
MTIEKHDLHSELPEFKDEIRRLKMENNHFARLFTEYHRLDHEIKRIEQGIENTTDEYLEELKLKRLQHKDELYVMLKKEQAPA